MHRTVEYRGFKIDGVVHGKHASCVIRDLRTDLVFWGKNVTNAYYYAEDKAILMGKDWIDGHLLRVASFLKREIARIEAERLSKRWKTVS